jgi:RES domain-containing protein
MRLWRISNFADLSGHGGLLVAGRWHSRGRRIVYLSDHPASALLEVLVHLEVDVDDIPDSYQLVAVEVPDEIAIDSIDIGALPGAWQQNLEATRALGDRWLAERRTALLRVPSAVIPHASNWLFNPAHADGARVAISEVKRVAFDPRLFGGT